MEHIAYLGLGSNLGDRLECITRAIGALATTEGVSLDRERDLAGVYETAPVDAPVESPPFLNTVVRVTTSLEPLSLLDACLAIEARLGRVRSTPNAPRTIDIDLLLYDDLVLNESGLTVPHPRLHQRLFVLEPLCELAPEAVYPVCALSVGALLTRARHRFRDQRVRRIATAVVHRTP